MQFNLSGINSTHLIDSHQVMRAGGKYGVLEGRMFLMGTSSLRRAKMKPFASISLLILGLIPCAFLGLLLRVLVSRLDEVLDAGSFIDGVLIIPFLGSSEEDEMQCEWEDTGHDMDGSWMTFPCQREATQSFTDDGNTLWHFCSLHVAEAEGDTHADEMADAANNHGQKEVK
jgi:uncharacterized SAM-binding protein YcdF (DUF218 family)